MDIHSTTWPSNSAGVSVSCTRHDLESSLIALWLTWYSFKYLRIAYVEQWTLAVIRISESHGGTYGPCLHRFVVSFFSLAWPHQDLLKMWFEGNDVCVQSIPVIIVMTMNEKASGVSINLDISGHSRRVWSLSCAFPVKNDCWVFGPVLSRVWRWCCSCWARGGSG